MPKPKSRAEAAIHELCVTFGYCISLDEANSIIAALPDDPDSVLDAVLRAEGFEHPELLEKDVRAPLVEVVRFWLFDDAEGRGAKSGLPRIPEG